MTTTPLDIAVRWIEAVANFADFDYIAMTTRERKELPLVIEYLRIKNQNTLHGQDINRLREIEAILGESTDHDMKNHPKE